MQTSSVHVEEVDPQSPDVLALLRLAASEARAVYPEFHDPSDSWPTNDPTPPKGVYLVAKIEGRIVGMGAHRPLTSNSSEIRRIYVDRVFRRHGVAKRLLAKLETHATEHGFSLMLLETGNRQAAAMALYESCGYARIAPFGTYINDPTSVCYEKSLAQLSPRVA